MCFTCVFELSRQHFETFLHSLADLCEINKRSSTESGVMALKKKEIVSTVEPCMVNWYLKICMPTDAVSMSHASTGSHKYDKAL